MPATRGPDIAGRSSCRTASGSCSRRRSAHGETNGVYLGSLDKTPPVRVLADDAAGRFAAPDKLLTIEAGRAAGVQLRSGVRHGAGEPVVIAQGFAGGIGAMAASDTGVLAYRTGSAQRRQLVWVDRKGTVLRTIGEPEIGIQRITGTERRRAVGRSVQPAAAATTTSG